MPSIGTYKVSCNATAPKFGIQIEDTMFHLQPADMIIRLGPSVPYCYSTIAAGLPTPKQAYPEGFYILGAAFLHNVVAVFDVEGGQMHFAKHEGYDNL